MCKPYAPTRNSGKSCVKFQKNLKVIWNLGWQYCPESKSIRVF
jgi:hypothetical protein